MPKINILIFSYYYPPNNSTPSNRIKSWTDYLPGDKYYPIVITWDWERETGTTEIKKFNGYEVHYVPRKINGFNRILNRSLKSNSIIKKPLLLIQLLLANTVEYMTNTEALNAYFNSYLNKKQVDVVVSSGSPFLLHVLVSRQKKKHSFAHIADYRDPWSNNEHIYKDNFVFRIIQSIDRAIEQKVSKKYDYLLAASEHQRKEICNHISFPHEKSDTMLNGFVSINYDNNKTPEENTGIQILFSGTFYLTQPLEDILQTINRKIENKTLPENTRIIFLGTAHVPEVAKRVQNAIVGYEKYYDITPRIEHSQAMKVQRESDLLIMPSHLGMKGIPSSKLFDYVSTGRPILLYPSDKDVLEEILKNTKLGLICNSEAEISDAIDKVMEAKNDGKHLVDPNPEAIMQYSRQEQTKVLASTIDKLLMN